MPSALYYAGLAALRFGARALAPFHAKTRSRSRGAARALTSLSPTPPNQDCYWMHCASVGEFEQGRPVWEGLRERYPAARFVLTFFSPSGVEWFAGRDEFGEIAYLPWDTRGAAERFVAARSRLDWRCSSSTSGGWGTTPPSARLASRRSLSRSPFGKTSPSSAAVTPLHSDYREALEGLDALFVQTPSSARLLSTHGYTVTPGIAGDTRLDRVVALAAEPHTDMVIERWQAGYEKVVVAGSTWPPDEAALVTLLRERPDYRLICVPHEVDDATRARLQRTFEPFGTASYTEAAAREARVLIVDAKGVLAKAYRYGRLAYVGGGFGSGIHNTLEPVAYGLAVAFGPRYERFDEALELVERGVAHACRDARALLDFVAHYDDSAALGLARRGAMDYLAERGGATAAIFATLDARRLLPPPAPDMSLSAHARHLLSLVDAFAGRRALVIGDVMLDEYVYGEVDRVSPEAPVPVVAMQRRETQPGGAANVALNVSSLGAGVQLVGLCGDDETGVLLREVLLASGIDGEHLVTSAARRTTRKTRVMAQGQQLLRVDTEDAAAPSAAETEALWAMIAPLIEGRPDVIVFEDYDKGALSEVLIARVVDAARAAGIPTVVDPKFRNFWAYRGVTLFKPNLKEIRAALPRLAFDVTNPATLQTGHEALVERLGQRGSLITLGAGGAFLSDGDFARHVPAHRRRIADVCGAGDTVVATSALALALGASSDNLIELANLSGGLACEYVGVHPIRREDFVRGVAGL